MIELWKLNYTTESNFLKWSFNLFSAVRILVVDIFNCNSSPLKSGNIIQLAVWVMIAQYKLSYITNTTWTLNETYEEFKKYCQMNFQFLFMGCILTIDYIEKGNSEVPEESIEEYLVSDHHSSVLSPEDSPIQTSKSKYSILSSLLCVTKC